MMQTCEPNCGCECNFDVLACREHRAKVAHNEAHDEIVRRAYAAQQQDEQD